MTQIDTAVGLARAEIATHTFGVTGQYLAVHEVVVNADGLSAIARVDDTSEVGAYHVYFELRDVPYHFVVVVGPDEAQTLSVSGHRARDPRVSRHSQFGGESGGSHA